MRRIVVGALLALLLVSIASPAGAADGDGDGVGNRRDRCPTIKAVGRPDGCPLGRWRVRDALTTGSADLTFRFGSVAQQAVVGDWDGDGDDTIGLVDLDPSVIPPTWAVVNRLRSGTIPDPTRARGSLGPPATRSGLRAIAGDWNGDGKDTIGVYDPSEGRFWLRATNASTASTVSFLFGGSQPRAQVWPVVGDWDDDGVDSVGIVRRDTNRWRLRDSNTAGPADHDFFWGDDNGDIPFGIDTDGDGRDTVGRTFRSGGRQRFQALPDLDANGDVLSWSLGDPNDGSRGPIQAFVGDWDGNGIDSGGVRSS
jgi:hypothetical protein